MKNTVIVTGGRDYEDYAMVADVLDLFDADLIIQGGAAGADRMARDYAYQNNIICETVKADWNKHGKAAGPIRNLEMLKKYPNAVVVAFPGGKGTENCVKQAASLNMIVLTVHK